MSLACFVAPPLSLHRLLPRGAQQIDSARDAGLLHLGLQNTLGPEVSEPGSGAVPYLHSSDLETLRGLSAQTGKAAPEIVLEPGIEPLKITGANGQLIEFFKLTAP